LFVVVNLFLYNQINFFYLHCFVILVRNTTTVSP